MPDAVDTVVCAPDDGWKYHPKHVEQFPDINKLCNVASCWIYTYIGILLGAHPIHHISRIRVNLSTPKKEAVRSSEIPASVYSTTRCLNPEYHEMKIHPLYKPENLEYRRLYVVITKY